MKKYGMFHESDNEGMSFLGFTHAENEDAAIDIAYSHYECSCDMYSDEDEDDFEPECTCHYWAEEVAEEIIEWDWSSEEFRTKTDILTRFLKVTLDKMNAIDDKIAYITKQYELLEEDRTKRAELSKEVDDLLRQIAAEYSLSTYQPITITPPPLKGAQL